MDEEEKTAPDMAFLGIPGQDGSIPVVRISSDPASDELRVSSGVLTPIVDGTSSLGREIVQVKPVAGSSKFEMTTLYDGRTSRSGPPMVNSSGFKAGWDAVFGDRGKSDLN